LSTDRCKFEPSHKDESRAQSADSSKAYRKPSRAFNCHLYRLLRIYLHNHYGERLSKIALIFYCYVKINCEKEVYDFLHGKQRHQLFIPNKLLLTCDCETS